MKAACASSGRLFMASREASLRKRPQCALPVQVQLELAFERRNKFTFVDLPARVSKIRGKKNGLGLMDEQKRVASAR